MRHVPVVVDPPPPEVFPEPGWHHAVCVLVRDVGDRETRWGTRKTVVFWFQLEARHPETGRRFVLHKYMHKSLQRGSRLLRMLEIWRARPLVATELETGINLSRWIGANAKVLVTLLPAKPPYPRPMAVIDEVLPPDPGHHVLAEDFKYAMWTPRER